MIKKEILVIIIVSMILALVLLSACTRTVKDSVVTHDTLYVESHSVDTVTIHDNHVDTIYVAKTDTLVKTDVVRDSVVVRDSIYVREKGDSIYVYREKWRTKVDIKHDTIYKAKRDTIFQTKEDTVVIYRYVERGDTVASSSIREKEKVKERHTWGWLLWGFAMLAAAGFVWKFLNK